jgi:uncharacterized coiled-coil protein SlyX
MTMQQLMGRLASIEARVEQIAEGYGKVVKSRARLRQLNEDMADIEGRIKALQEHPVPPGYHCLTLIVGRC